MSILKNLMNNYNPLCQGIGVGIKGKSKVFLLYYKIIKNDDKNGG